MKYLIKIDDQIYEVEVTDLRNRPIVAIVNGESFDVEPQSGQSYHPPAAATPVTTTSTQLVQARPVVAPPTGVTPNAGTLVRAPIPGVIIALLVRPGDEITHGQDLCTIEAMKMRNSIRAARGGRIAEILVTTGQTVNHNDPLMRFEEQS